MPPRAKPKKPGQEKPKEPRHLRIRPSGRTFKGSIVTRCVRSGTRVALWHRDRMGTEDDPQHIGVFIGLLCPRDATPRLALAVNADTLEIPVEQLGYLAELPPDANRPEEEDDEG